MLPLRGPRLSATPNLRGLSPDTKPLTPHPCKSFSVKRGFLHKNDGAKHFFCARSTKEVFCSIVFMQESSLDREGLTWVRCEGFCVRGEAPQVWGGRKARTP